MCHLNLNSFVSLMLFNYLYFITEFATGKYQKYLNLIAAIFMIFLHLLFYVIYNNYATRFSSLFMTVTRKCFFF